MITLREANIEETKSLKMLITESGASAQEYARALSDKDGMISKIMSESRTLK